MQLCASSFPHHYLPPPGAGKTYTMTGDRSSFQQRGLIPRTISELITQLRADPGLASWQLRVSYLEVRRPGPPPGGAVSAGRLLWPTSFPSWAY
jgi:hypothetical protein